MDLYGATLEDFAQVKVKNAKHGLQNPNARYRKETSVEDVLASPVVADPLRLLDICATSDGAAALIVASKRLRREAPRLARRGAVGARGLDGDAALPAARARIAGHRNRFDRGGAAPERVFKDQILDAAYAEAGHRARGPQPGRGLRPVHRARARLVRAPRAVQAKGEAEALLRSGATTIGGRIPVNPSGGLACFGEAIPPRPSRRCAS
jgi:acetyl-CoA acetyltransferase